MNQFPTNNTNSVVPILGFGHSRRKRFENREAFDFTLGKILGDGHINKKNQLEIDQRQREYTEWNQQQTKRLGLSSQNATITMATRRRLNKDTFKYDTFTSFRCYSSALFQEFREKFYRKKTPTDPTFGRGSDFRKCYPAELQEWLTSPYALAVFYMDDGGIQSQTPYFATGEVSTEEVLFLKEIFEKNFHLQVTLSKAATTVATKNFMYRGLLLRRGSRKQFFDLVAPTIMEVPCMRSKLDFLS